MNDTTAAQRAGPHGSVSPLMAGTPLTEASYALVLVHGRGGSAEGMLPIAKAAKATDAALVAPVAVGNSWYPKRFLDPREQNEPWLSSALASVGAAVEQVRAGGIPSERIILVGFSQGACLMLEYATMAAKSDVRFGGVAALAGGLIGDPLVARDDRGSLGGTPVLLACGNADSHIPEAIVRSSAEVFRQLDASVDLRIYPGIGHDIVGDEIDALTEMVNTLRGAQ
ncbi:dienelactone hydrolase family protein [Gemmatimonas sp.]|uniref:alpha/beta hydrolase n=1 Tax=Gemmatimonas sp. TaxID=1962908 RepID=UPI00286E3CCD|nr:dienelactone hydrolase family protein [Gemmatimonas sp.]